MLKKKILFIILGIIALVFFVLIFFLSRNINNKVVAPASEQTTNIVNKMPQAETNTNNQSKPNSNLAAANNTIANSVTPLDPVMQAKYFSELRINHPEFSATQLEFYNETAASQKMSPCRGREDEANCVYAVALITRFYNFCGEVPNNREKQLDCANIILSERAGVEITKCQVQTTDRLKTRCLFSIFNIYNQTEDCRNLIPSEVKQMCENVANFKIAEEKQNMKLCENITDNSLKNTCLEDTTTIAPTTPDIPTNPSTPVTPKDTDGDGLSDQDELNKYFTNPLLTDTDGDTFSDGAEISGGYNPCGEGKLNSPELLKELCAQFTK